MLEKLLLDKNVDIVTLHHIRSFVSKNPIFIDYVNKLKEVPSLFRDKTTIKRFMIQEVSDADTWKNFCIFGVFAENLPEIVNKIIDLPDILTYSDFERVITDVIEPDYFYPELTKWQVFSLYVKVCIKFNENVETFPVFGIYDKNKELDEPELLEIWNNEKNIVKAFENMYKVEINCPNDVYRIVSGWVGNPHIGYILAMELGDKHFE